MKNFLIVLPFVISSFLGMAQEDGLVLTVRDVYIEEGGDGGFHIWVRKNAAIGSVLLTESTVDPQNRNAIYALRATGYNPINGDEKRILNGQFLEGNQGIIDSTPEPDERFGRAFHLFLPYLVEYGYAWTRSGTMQILDNTFINIKTFAKPYADWSGATADNPFLIAIKPQDEQIAVPEGDYRQETIQEFVDIAAKGNGEPVFIKDAAEIIPQIKNILEEQDSPQLDLVLNLDTTLSMRQELPFLKTSLVPLIRQFKERFNQLRVGLVFYRDYKDKYLVKPFAFTSDLTVLQASLDTAQAEGGREVPEAVYEALYNSLVLFDWQVDSRLIILIGDAPPHPEPVGKITSQMVFDEAKELGVRIYTFILPE